MQSNGKKGSKMTGRLKALGLALMALCALGAMSAAAASAQEKHFRSDIPNTVLTGTDEGTSAFSIPEEGTTTCDHNLYEGTVEGEKASEITIEHTVTAPCETDNINTHVAFNGCAYVFTLENGRFKTEDNSEHTRGPAHIECPEGKEITLTITVPFLADCIIHIPPQTPTEPTVDYTNEGAGTTQDVKVVSTIKGIHYTTTDPPGHCPQETGHDAEFHAEITVKGFTDTSKGGAGETYKHDNEQHAVWIEET